jgi:general secretion pathway protein I
MVLEAGCFHGVGAFEGYLFKVFALKLFHPSACSVFQSSSHFSLFRKKVSGVRRKSVRLDSEVRSGFTLIEVVVALAILSVGLTVVIELFAGGLRLARVSEEYTKAVNYGRIKMEEIAVKPKIEEGSEEGKFDSTFRWQVGVKKVDVLPIEKKPDIEVPVELFQIQVKVIWKSGSKERSTSVETYKMMRVEENEKES